jgi:hypothetical protein
VPYLFIWIAALFSVIQYKKYVSLISKSSEAVGFNYIVKGLMMLFVQLIISPFIGLPSSYNPDSLVIQKTVTIFRNDLTIILYLSAFYFFWRASKVFINTLINKDVKDKILYKIIPLLVVPLGAALIWFILHNDFRTFSSHPDIRPTYFLSDASIFITIVIPYIIIWLLGFITLFNLRLLNKNVEGIIYKKSFNAVSIGLAIIIGLTISLQFLTQATTYFKDAGLGVIILLVYLILFCIAAAYIYFALGAKYLTKIEKI